MFLSLSALYLARWAFKLLSNKPVKFLQNRQGKNENLFTESTARSDKSFSKGVLTQHKQSTIEIRTAKTLTWTRLAASDVNVMMIYSKKFQDFDRCVSNDFIKCKFYSPL